MPGRGEDHVELLLVKLAVVRRGCFQPVLDRAKKRAFQDVAFVLADLCESSAGRLDADAMLNGDLEDLPLLDLVDVLVVVAAEPDLIDKPFLDLVQRHDRAPTGGNQRRVIRLPAGRSSARSIR